MKSFRNFISEEVLPSVQVADGGLDIEKPAVRAAINAAIAGVVSQPAVTPYVVFNRLSKLLAQYHIVLPKRFLEGDKGVEVFEVKQFGHKMGMTDSGEFVNQVPSTHYLFLQYGIITPMGVTYAKPIVGGMFRVTARLVDKEELDKLLDMAEISLREEAECRQNAAKANAPKEPMHDITSDEKKKGNKEAVEDSEKGLKEEQIDEVSTNKARSYLSAAGAKQKETKKKLNAINRNSPDLYSSDKAWYDYSNAHGQRGPTHDKNERLKSGMRLAKRKMDPTSKVKVHTTEEQIDEVSKGAAIRAYGAARDASDSDSRAEKNADRLKKHIVRKFGAKTGEHAERHAYASHFGRPKTDYGTDRLSRAKPSSEMRKTQSGKIHKQDVESKKSEIKFRKSMSKFDKKTNLPEEKNDLADACWKGYTAKGLKKKGGKMVPNCVPVSEEKGDRLTPQTMNNPTGKDKTGASERDRGITFVPKNPKGNDSDMPQNTLKPEGKFTNRVDPEGRKNEYAPGGTMYESAPPGREDQVRALKKKFPKGSGSPFAIAWSSYKKSKGE